MSELEYLKLKDGTEYPYCVSVNVIAAIQKKYGSFEDAMATLDVAKVTEINYSVLIDFYYEAINEGIDIYNENKKEEDKKSFISEKQAGRIIMKIGYDAAKNKMQDAMIASSQFEVLDCDDDLEKN